jgi:hypothetical protein
MAATGGAVVIQIGKGIDIAYLAHQAATPHTHECQHQRKSMKKEYQPMLATLVDQPFDSKDWRMKPSGTASGSSPK